MADYDMVDVSSLNEPDPSWSFTDPAGHVHRWVGDWRHSDLPTLELIWDDPEDDDSDFPRRSHYECRECRAHVEPATMASPQRRFVPGLRS